MLRVVEHASRTDLGCQRKGNEDVVYVVLLLFVVVDGMGGAQVGEVASRVAIEAFLRDVLVEGSVEERLVVAVLAANRWINEMVHNDRRFAGMGTIVIVVYVGWDEVVVVQVGDSRVYRVCGGDFVVFTRDHTLVQVLIDQGRLSEEEVQHHLQRSVIIRVFGLESHVEVEMRTHRAQGGDVYLLCSDGLTSMVDEDIIVRIVESVLDLERAAVSLVDAANAAGGRDNITVVLFRVEDGDVDGGDVGVFSGEFDTVVEQSTGAASVVTVSRRFPSAIAFVFVPAAPPVLFVVCRRWSRWGFCVLIVLLLFVVLLLAGGWIASRAVYFVGIDDVGFVTVYCGLFYDLLVGVKLYERFYVSGVFVTTLWPARRERFFGYDWRFRDDAVDLVQQLELGRFEP